MMPKTIDVTSAPSVNSKYDMLRFFIPDIFDRKLVSMTA